MKIFKSQPSLDDYIQNLKDQNRPYQIIKKNGETTVISDKEKNWGGIYRRPLKSGNVKSLWIFGYVRNIVKKLEGKIDVDMEPEPVPGVFSDAARFESLDIGTKFIATDINHAYWRTAFLLGYITEKCYNRFVGPDYKEIRNKALACLTSRKHVQDWQGEELLKEEIIEDKFLTSVYKHIRYTTYTMLMNAGKLAGDSFLKYKTDCLYYLPDRQPVVEAYLKSQKVGFGSIECVKVDYNLFLEGDNIKEF